MSGATPAHARLEERLGGMLDRGLRGTGCRAYGPSMHLAIKATRSFVHPDKSIVCGPLEFDAPGAGDRGVTNPRVVVEILSESTGDYDRGEKFRKYDLVPSIEEYVLIDQREPSVQSFLRQPDGAWNLVFFHGPDAVARIRCLPLDLPLAELYAEE